MCAARDHKAELPRTVLILGSARSGTTLLAKIFDSAPNVLYRHEPDSTKITTAIPFLPHPQETANYLAPAAGYMAELTRQRDPKSSGTRPVFPKAFRSPAGTYGFLASIYLSKLAGKAGLSLPIPDFARPGVDKVHVIKSVNSLCRAELFLDAVPDLRVVHIVRHPCGVAASLNRGMDSGQMGSRAHIGSHIDDLFNAGIADGFGYAQEEIKQGSFEQQAAFKWMVQNSFVYDRLADHERYMLVSYEEICTAVHSTAQRLYDFAGLAWQDQTERFLTRTEGKESDSGNYFGIDKKLDASLYTWRETLPAESIEQ
ncbi:MAG: sulfotransferase, partial [Pseudomonadota bacterium]